MTLSDKPTINEISEYVQETARYDSGAPHKKYFCRYPHAYGAKVIVSNDTWDIVEQIAKAYGVRAK